MNTSNPTPNRLSKPSRAVLFRVIGNCFNRHNIKPQKPTHEILDVVKTADYDTLVELAFLAMSDIGDEETHKELFIKQCKEVGIE